MTMRIARTRQLCAAALSALVGLACTGSGSGSDSGAQASAAAAKRSAPDDAIASPSVPSTPSAEELSRAQSKSNLSSDEELTLYPTWMVQDDSGPDGVRWRGQLRAWIYEPEQSSLARRALRSQLRDVFGGETAPLRGAVAASRISLFTHDSERGERLSFAVGNAIFYARPSTAAGRILVELWVPGLGTSGEVGRAEVQVVTKRRDERQFSGQLFLLPTQGTLLVSDIDDTVKHTHVRDKLAMLRATFLEPFRFVDGMAARYRSWLGPGDHLHFVSASPYQLYPALSSGLREAGFPDATYTLRELRMDVVDLMKLAEPPTGLKSQAIGDMIGRLPEWKVVLVGDSGERDPEIYGRLARKFPQQIVAIYIRNASGEAADAPRFQQAFEGLPPSLWQVFNNANELPETLPVAAPRPAE